MRLGWIRWIAAVFLGFMLGCRATAPPVPSGPNVLHLAAPDDVPTLDPALGYDTASWGFEQMLFDTLVRYSDAGVNLVPDLALSWTIAPDAKIFAFRLRNDARFSSGRAVTSADFRYSVERVLRPATRSKGIEYYREIAGAEDFIAGRAAHVSGIETPSADRIIFHLTASDPIFIHKLAMPFAAAVPHEVADHWGDDFSRHVVGSGPFVLSQWLPGQRIVLRRNPHYFVNGLPHLDAIVEQLGVGQELQWLQFQSGAIDLAAIPPAEFPYVMKTPALKALTLHITTLSTDYLGMNCQVRPFNDVRVRRAINYAIRKPKLLAILNGRGVVADGILPPGLPGYDPHVNAYPYDPANARALLEAAGVGSNFSPVLWMRADQIETIQGESIQQDLAAVGVHAVLTPVAWPPLLEAVRQRDTVQFVSLGWEADFPDPQNFLEVLFSKKQWGVNNDTFYDNPEVDRLLAAAAPLTDLNRRYALYDKAQRLIMADAPWVPLYHPATYVIRQPWVHDYILNPMRPARLETIWLAPHEIGGATSR